MFRYVISLCAVLVLASCGAESTCASDADCGAGEVCLASGGVFFGSTVCVGEGSYAFDVSLPDASSDDGSVADVASPDVALRDLAEDDRRDAGTPTDGCFPDATSPACAPSDAGCEPDDCDPNASCTPMHGGAECVCEPGFRGDGTTCTARTLVVSVQQLELELAPTDASTTTLLPTPVASENSVVFPTRRLASAAPLSESLVDVYLSSDDELTVTRAAAGTRVAVVVSVVEFDPMLAQVQKGTFSGVGRVDLSAFDRERSFVLFTYELATTERSKTDEMLSASLTADGAIEFDRVGTVGTPAGHWAVVTALDGAFAVQHIAMSVSMTNELAMVDAVDLGRTLLIYSGRTDHGGFGGGHAHVGCGFSSGTGTDLLCLRALVGEETVDVRVQIVEMPEASVQRTQEVLNVNQIASAVTLDEPVGSKGMAWLGMTGSVGAAPTSQADAPSIHEAYVTLRLTPDGKQAVIEREAGANASVSPVWQVVDWP